MCLPKRLCCSKPEKPAGFVTNEMIAVRQLNGNLLAKKYFQLFVFLS